MEHVEADETDTLSKEMSEQGSSKQAREEQSQGSSEAKTRESGIRNVTRTTGYRSTSVITSVELKLYL